MADRAMFAAGNQNTGQSAAAEQSTPEFFEQQRYSGWQLIALIAFLLAGLSYRFLEQHFLINDPSPLGVLPFLTMVVLLGAALTYLLKIRISVRADKNGIYVSRAPFERKPLSIQWSEVDFCEMVKTPVLAQWSGSNILLHHERVFSVCGKNGVHLTTRDGDNIFIGSRKPDELQAFIENVLR